MGLLGGKPYTKQVSRSTLQGFLDKATTFKGKRGLHRNEFEKICKSPKIKNNPNLSRIAHSISKQMGGHGPRNIKIKTHHAKQFTQAFAEAVEESKETGIGLTKFGKRKMIDGPKAGFQKYVVEEEISGQKPAGPTKEELAAEKRRKIARQNLNRYERAKQIEKEQGRFRINEPEREKEATIEKNNKKGIKGETQSKSSPSVSVLHGSIPGAGQKSVSGEENSFERLDSENEIGSEEMPEKLPQEPAIESENNLINREEGAKKRLEEKEKSNSPKDPSHFGKDLDEASIYDSSEPDSSLDKSA